jgi:hypothetical protein
MALPNWEITVYALYLMGGESRWVHTEDIAVKCFEIAPDSFSWIKYRNYPDKEIARIALMDARKEKMGALVTGRSGKGKGHFSGAKGEPRPDGWQLTQAGITWITQNEDRLAKELGHRQPKSHRQELLQKMARVRNHSLFKEFQEQREDFTPSIGSLAELLRCRVDADGHVWEKRFSALRNLAQLAEEEDVLEFIGICQRFVESGKEGQS